MTKVKKFWLQMSFWNKIKAVIAAFGAGGEITMLATDQSAGWHFITIGATVLGVLITQFIQDNNNNGIPDAFEK
jgi:hypothetical protein